MNSTKLEISSRPDNYKQTGQGEKKEKKHKEIIKEYFISIEVCIEGRFESKDEESFGVSKQQAD